MYLLDTNILSELIKKRPSPNVLSRLDSKTAQTLFTSSICIMELRFGGALREDSEVFWKKIDREILSRINVIYIGLSEALAAGDILASLRKTGQIIGVDLRLFLLRRLDNPRNVSPRLRSLHLLRRLRVQRCGVQGVQHTLRALWVACDGDGPLLPLFAELGGGSPVVQGASVDAHGACELGVGFEGPFCWCGDQPVQVGLVSGVGERSHRC